MKLKKQSALVLRQRGLKARGQRLSRGIKGGDDTHSDRPDFDFSAAHNDVCGVKLKADVVCVEGSVSSKVPGKGIAANGG